VLRFHAIFDGAGRGGGRGVLGWRVLIALVSRRDELPVKSESEKRKVGASRTRAILDGKDCPIRLTWVRQFVAIAWTFWHRNCVQSSVQGKEIPRYSSCTFVAPFSIPLRPHRADKIAGRS